MEIRVISDQVVWELGLASMDGGVGFISSWGWGEFQREYGSKVVRLGLFEENLCRGVIYGVEQAVPFVGKFIYFPHCAVATLRTELMEYLRLAGYFMVRIEPLLQWNCADSLVCRDVANRQPRQSLVFSLSGSEDDLMARMHEKTRYNIRLAMRKGVMVREKNDAELFFALNKTTTKRDGFKSHDKKYYEMMLANPAVKMFVAEFDGRSLAAAIGIIFEKTFVYLHGASSDQQRNLMAPYLLQWEAMRFARAQGCVNYDFWGVAPRVSGDMPSTVCFHDFCYNSEHAWAGVTRFKAGFGGEYVEHPEAREVILNDWKYKLFSFVKKIL